ncbi:MAG: uracil-DNA glycosylase family protein [Planctomycetota bacterium]
MAAGIETAARALAEAVAQLRFAPPVHYVYNPLAYAWGIHRAWCRRYGIGCKRVVFLGMNPGPFGMAQVGVPFGEIAAVRDWLGLTGTVGRPDAEHPKRPITGFACTRSEVSGRRLWGLFAERYGTAESFFREHFVINYCPLVFLAESGRNITPDKLPKAGRTALEAVCDTPLRAGVAALQPEWLVGVGAFAAAQAERCCADTGVRIGRVLHPSPASPAANRGWAAAAQQQLEEQGIW